VAKSEIHHKNSLFMNFQIFIKLDNTLSSEFGNTV